MKNDVNNKMEKAIEERSYIVTDIVSDYFYQLPKWLINDERYSKMSDKAKIAYALIRDRFEYSVKNNWFDEKGRIYFIFTVKELEKLLNISRPTVTKVKAELVKFGLLGIKHVHFDPKAKRQQPDRWYLLRPELNVQDIRQANSQSQNVGSLEQSKSKISFPRQSEPRIPVNQGSSVCEVGSALEQSKSKISFPRQSEPRIPVNQDSSHVKFAHALEPSKSKISFPNIRKELDNLQDTFQDNYKDTQNPVDYTSDDDVFNFENKNYTPEQIEMQNLDLNKHFVDTYTDTPCPIPLSKEALQLLRMWFTDNKELRVVVGKIYSAKRQSEETARRAGVDFDFALEDVDLQERLTKTIRRYLNIMRSDEGKKIKNPANYFYQSLVNMFDSWQNEQLSAIHEAKKQDNN